MGRKIRDQIQSHLRTIGSRGGKKSRRRLDPAVARRMVAVREARKAFEAHRHDYFWSAPETLVIDESMLPFVIQGLKNEGNRRAFEKARQIQRLMKGTPCRQGNWKEGY